MSDTTLLNVKLTKLIPWPGLNPRTRFPEGPLAELAASIRDDGLLQPLSVVAAPKGKADYWIFAGERRYRAGKLAKVAELPVIVHDIDETKAHRLAGIENLDRNDLTPIEEAAWLARELELNAKLTQAKLAKELDRSQSWVANRIRLLGLPDALRTLLHEGVIAPAMARDHLLRFGKLAAGDAATAYKAIVAEVKKTSKEEGGAAVPLLALQHAIARALDRTPAVVISAGYHYVNGNYNAGGATVTDDELKAFRKEHAKRTVQAPAPHYTPGERTWTFATEEWAALVKEKVQESRRGLVKEEKIDKAKLGPAHKPVSSSTLKRQFGYDAVLDFDDVVAPENIEPKHLVRSADVEGRHYYVGPKVRGVKMSRGRQVNAALVGIREADLKARLDAAEKIAPHDVLKALMDLARQSDLTHTLAALLEASGVTLGEGWNRYATGAGQVVALEIPKKAAKRVAAALAAAVIEGESDWKIEAAQKNKAEAKVKRATAKKREAFLEAHGFRSESKKTKSAPKKKSAGAKKRAAKKGGSR